jgi:hypothetical protein
MEKSIFDNDSLFYHPSSSLYCSDFLCNCIHNPTYICTSLDKEQIIAETKEQMRKEFIEVYSKNEEYYQNYIFDLSKQLEEKNKTIQQLVDMLHKK